MQRIWIPDKIYRYYPFFLIMVGVVSVLIQTAFSVILSLGLIVYGVFIIFVRFEYKNGD